MYYYFKENIKAESDSMANTLVYSDHTKPTVLSFVPPYRTGTYVCFASVYFQILQRNLQEPVFIITALLFYY